MAGGMGMAAIADYNLLFPTAALVGLSYGAIWGVIPVVILELFGPDNFGTLYTTLAIAPALSSLAMATGLVRSFETTHD